MNDFFSVIIPVYKNEEFIHELLQVLSLLNEQLNGKMQAVFVVDGSPDCSYSLLYKSLKNMDFPSKLVLLSRNFGSFSAIRAGLQIADGNYCAVMSADLQEPYSILVEMNKILRETDADVVLGVRSNRKDPFFSQLCSNIFWRLYRFFIMSDVPLGGVDIFACSRDFKDRLLQLNESNTSLIAQIFWLGYNRHFIYYERQKRKYGKSAWTMKKKIDYFMNSVFCFSDLPIRILIYLGAIASVFSGFFGVAIFISRLLGLIAVPGYAAIVLVIIFFGALNMLSLGIVGSYAWRSYENSKNRPLHVTWKVHVFEPHEKKS